MEDYFALEPLLIAYLKTLCTEAEVIPLTDSTDLDQVAPRRVSVFTMFAGEVIDFRNGASQLSPTVQVVTQRWLTVVSVQSAARVLDGLQLRQKAGPTLAKLSGLQGVKLKGFGPLRRVTPPGPRYKDNFAHFPLLWEVECDLAN